MCHRGDYAPPRYMLLKLNQEVLYDKIEIEEELNCTVIEALGGALQERFDDSRRRCHSVEHSIGAWAKVKNIEGLGRLLSFSRAWSSPATSSLDSVSWRCLARVPACKGMETKRLTVFWVSSCSADR